LPCSNWWRIRHLVEPRRVSTDHERSESQLSGCILDDAYHTESLGILREHVALGSRPYGRVSIISSQCSQTPLTARRSDPDLVDANNTMVSDILRKDQRTPDDFTRSKLLYMSHVVFLWRVKNLHGCMALLLSTQYSISTTSTRPRMSSLA
jgi:hypothetical protein